MIWVQQQICFLFWMCRQKRCSENRTPSIFSLERLTISWLRFHLELTWFLYSCYSDTISKVEIFGLLSVPQRNPDVWILKVSSRMFVSSFLRFHRATSRWFRSITVDFWWKWLIGDVSGQVYSKCPLDNSKDFQVRDELLKPIHWCLDGWRSPELPQTSSFLLPCFLCALNKPRPHEVQDVVVHPFHSNR